MILVTTAGKVGSQASRLLAQRGIAVRVIARNAEKAAALVSAALVIPTLAVGRVATVDQIETDRVRASLRSVDKENHLRGFFERGDRT